MSAYPLVSILVVTWNRRGCLARCLDSAFGQTYSHKEIVLVDNGSDDGTAEFVRTNYPEIRLFSVPSNLGCPSGRNFGVGHCAGEFVYFLDDDGWLGVDTIEIAMRRAEQDSSIGVVMSQIQIVQNGVVVDKRPTGISQPVFRAEFVGCCCLIRKDVFQELGGYPGDFFNYGEELDFALRLLDGGHFVFLDPASVMFHEPSPIGRDLKTLTYWGLRHTNKTALRHWPFPYGLLKVMLNIFYSVKYMFLLSYPALPWQILRELGTGHSSLPRETNAGSTEDL